MKLENNKIMRKILSYAIAGFVLGVAISIVIPIAATAYFVTSPNGGSIPGTVNVQVDADGSFDVATGWVLFLFPLITTVISAAGGLWVKRKEA